MNEFPIMSGLAELPEKALVDERALASIFHVSTRTIARWVQSNALPVPARFGAKRVWIAGRILAFIEARVAAAEATSKRQGAASEKGIDAAPPSPQTIAVQ